MSEAKDDGGPAFPFEIRHQKVLPSGQGVGPVSIITHHGMSKRDWFAGQALAAWPMTSRGTAQELAANCYALADAMLAERSKP